jgi:hypothetical protein
MPTIQTLATGLAGAIGSSYHGASNRLYFVEYGGKLSRYDFVREPDTVLVSGTRTLKGTWLMDLDTGAMTSNMAAADIWWEQIDGVKRRMVPRAGARIAYLGKMTLMQFTLLGTAQLQALSYGTAPIVGDNNANNLLVAGAVFAVRTNGGHYAKVRVTTYGYDIKLNIRTYRLKPAYQVLGTGYSEPEDVKVSIDGNTAFITERGGRLLRVALNTAVAPNRSAAVVVASGMQAPHQISLHEDRGLAYVVEYANPGHLVRINLASGAKTNVAFGLDRAIGLLVSGDHKHAFVSEQSGAGGRVRRIELDTGAIENVIGGFTAPFMMAFNDASESAILLAERDPANRIALIDLGVRPVVSRVVAAGVAARPSSVALVGGSKLLVCSDTVLSSVELAESLLTGSGPLLLGIGHVPVDRITGGYADTSVDPAYFFQVKDCPFGGTLPMMFNHERARLMNAVYYKVFVDGVETHAPWGDYRWSTATNRFEYVAVLPDAAGFYSVRKAGELWYNAWLGLARDTADLPNGAHQLSVRVYNAAKTQILTPRHDHQRQPDDRQLDAQRSDHLDRARRHARGHLRHRHHRARQVPLRDQRARPAAAPAELEPDGAVGRQQECCHRRRQLCRARHAGQALGRRQRHGAGRLVGRHRGRRPHVQALRAHLRAERVGAHHQRLQLPAPRQRPQVHHHHAALSQGGRHNAGPTTRCRP